MCTKEKFYPYRNRKIDTLILNEGAFDCGGVWKGKLIWEQSNYLEYLELLKILLMLEPMSIVAIISVNHYRLKR